MLSFFGVTLALEMGLRANRCQRMSDRGGCIYSRGGTGGVCNRGFDEGP